MVVFRVKVLVVLVVVVVLVAVVGDNTDEVVGCQHGSDEAEGVESST